MKIIKGEKYKNIHNGKIYIVTDKIFFNVAYREWGEKDAGSPEYAHYKTFRKHFKNLIEILEQKYFPEPSKKFTGKAMDKINKTESTS